MTIDVVIQHGGQIVFNDKSLNALESWGADLIARVDVVTSEKQTNNICEHNLGKQFIVIKYPRRQGCSITLTTYVNVFPS